jgi:hypothetical protein
MVMLQNGCFTFFVMKVRAKNRIDVVAVLLNSIVIYRTIAGHQYRLLEWTLRFHIEKSGGKK